MIKHPILAFVSIAFALTLLMASAAHAQTGGPYELAWSTIDGGGGSASGGAYTLSGTAGQPDAATMSGGNYVLGGGFWGGGPLHSAPVYAVYLPVILR